MNTTTLLAWAKSRALPVHSCVTARLRPDHLIGEASREELAALVEVLALAADPGRLRAVTAASGGRPDVGDRALMLRAAHTEAARLRRGHQDVPLYLLRLEREYWRSLRPASAPAPQNTTCSCGLEYDITDASGGLRCSVCRRRQYREASARYRRRQKEQAAA